MFIPVRSAQYLRSRPCCGRQCGWGSVWWLLVAGCKRPPALDFRSGCVMNRADVARVSENPALRGEEARADLRVLLPQLPSPVRGEATSQRSAATELRSVWTSGHQSHLGLSHHVQRERLVCDRLFGQVEAADSTRIGGQARGRPERGKERDCQSGRRGHSVRWVIGSEC